MVTRSARSAPDVGSRVPISTLASPVVTCTPEVSPPSPAAAAPGIGIEPRTPNSVSCIALTAP
jgi:hypothetical protein